MKLSDLQFERGSYLAFELSQKSRAELIKLFKPQFEKVICHHVTIDFNLTPEKLDRLKDTWLKPGSPQPKVLATGIATGDGIECISVTIDGSSERLDGSFYHITLSLRPPNKPVDSNKLRDKIHAIRGIVPIEGEFKLLKK